MTTLYLITRHGRNCTKWGVVTTIFGPEPSEAVRRFLYRRKNWCVVVVGDKGRPDSVRQKKEFICNQFL